MMMEEEADDVVFDSALLIKKRRTGGHRQSRDSMWQRPAKLRKHRAARTSCLCAAFLCLGLTAAVTGPTLPYFEERLQVDVGKLSYMFAARCFGYLVGSVAGGVLFDQIGQFSDLLLGAGLLAGALGLALAPFVAGLVLLCCMLAVTGLANGFLYSGGIIVCSRQWGTRSAPYLQGLYFAISVGAFAAPLLSAPFLGAPVNLPVYGGGVVPDGIVSTAMKRPLALPKRALLSGALGGGGMSAMTLPSVPLPPSSLPTDVVTPRSDIAGALASVIGGGDRAAPAPLGSQPVVKVAAGQVGLASALPVPKSAVDTSGHERDDPSISVAGGQGPPITNQGGVPARKEAPASSSTMPSTTTPSTTTPSTTQPSTTQPSTVTPSTATPSTTTATTAKPTVPPETTPAKPLKPQHADGGLLSQDARVAAGQDLGSQVIDVIKASEKAGQGAAAAAAPGPVPVLKPALSPADTQNTTASVTGTTAGILSNNVSRSNAESLAAVVSKTSSTEETTTRYLYDASSSNSSHGEWYSTVAGLGGTTSWENATGGDVGATASPDAETLSAAVTASASDAAVARNAIGGVLREGSNSSRLVTTPDRAATEIALIASSQTSNFSRSDGSLDGRNESAVVGAPSFAATAALRLVEALSETSTGNEMTSHAPSADGTVNNDPDDGSDIGSRVQPTSAFDYSTVTAAAEAAITAANSSAAGGGGFEVTTVWRLLPTAATPSRSHDFPAGSALPLSGKDPAAIVVDASAATTGPSTSDAVARDLLAVTIASAAATGGSDAAPAMLPADQALPNGGVAAGATAAASVPSPAASTTVPPLLPSTQLPTSPRSADVTPVAVVIDRHGYSALLDDVQVVYLALSACLALVALCFVLLFTSDREGVGVKSSATGNGSAAAVAPDAAERPLPAAVAAGGSVLFMSRILALVFVMCMLYVGIEVTFGQLLATYAARLAALTERQAALLTAAFWGPFALGRGLSALALLRRGCVSPAALLACGLSASCGALLVLSFATAAAAPAASSSSGGAFGIQSALWIGTGLLGAGLAPIFPTCFAWTQQYVDVGGKVASVLVGGSSLGGMVLPVVGGHLLERAGPAPVMYALLGAATACLFVYALAWYVAVVASTRDGGRLCDGGSGGGGGAGGYKAVATDSRPPADDDDDGCERQPPAPRSTSKRNTGHKRVSFRLLDDDSDKDF